MHTDRKTLKPLKIGELTVEKPIIQGGMGVGVSRSNLAGAVAAEGGIGIISTAQIGYDEEGFEKDQAGCNRIAIRKHIHRAKEIAEGKGLVGVNIMVALKHYKEHVQEAVRAGADVIISGAGLPMDLPKLVGNNKTKIAPIVSSRRATQLILKMWAHRYNRTADFIVIEGPKAGGHLGFDREQLETYTQESYDNEIERIMAVVRKYAQKYQVHIPVAVAGGISDKDAAEHAFSLGADAVQAATRFVTTWECDADLSYKQSYLNAKKEDVILVKSPVGMPGRAIKNPFISHVMAGERVKPKRCLGCLKNCNPAEVPYCITEALIKAAKGEIGEALLFCGADVWKAEKIETVKEVIDSLLGDCV